MLVVLKIFVPHRGGNEFELLPTNQNSLLHIFRSELCNHNNQQAGITLIVKSTTLLLGDWLSPLPDIITKADISIIMPSKP